MLYFAKNLARTRQGRAWVAIRDNDLAAEALGINLFYYKAQAFATSSFYAGIAGCLWAFWAGAASTEPFDLQYSVWLLGMVIVGGLGTILGSVLGAAAIVSMDRLALIASPAIEPLLPTVTKGTIGASLAPIVFGTVLMLFLIFEPRGLAHRWEIIRSWWQLYPFRY
jgi:branched-chain amino acid transport system permease protein